MASAGSAVVTECECAVNSVATNYTNTVASSSAKTTPISDSHIMPAAEVTTATPKPSSAGISSPKPACMPPTSQILDLNTDFAPAVGSDH